MEGMGGTSMSCISGSDSALARMWGAQDLTLIPLCAALGLAQGLSSGGPA